MIVVIGIVVIDILDGCCTEGLLYVRMWWKKSVILCFFVFFAGFCERSSVAFLSEARRAPLLNEGLVWSWFWKFRAFRPPIFDFPAAATQISPAKTQTSPRKIQTRPRKIQTRPWKIQTSPRKTQIKPAITNSLPQHLQKIPRRGRMGVLSSIQQRERTMMPPLLIIDANLYKPFCCAKVEIVNCYYF